MRVPCALPKLWLALFLICCIGADGVAKAADLSPQHWPQAARIAAEQAELTAPSPLTARRIAEWRPGR